MQQQWNEPDLKAGLEQAKIFRDGTLLTLRTFADQAVVYVLPHEFESAGDSELDLKDKALLTALAVFRLRQNVELVITSFVLPGPVLVEFGRGRDVHITREDVSRLQTGQISHSDYLNHLRFDPDVRTIEDRIRESGFLASTTDFAVLLMGRTHAHVTIVDKTTRISEENMKTYGFFVAKTVFENDQKVQEVRSAFKGYSKDIRLSRQQFEGLSQLQERLAIESLEVGKFVAAHMW